MIQRILGAVMLAAGVVYGAVIVKRALGNRAALKEGPSLWLVGLCEAAVYFFASLGISDYLQNTLIYKRLRLGDDERLPGTLVACTLTPGAIIAHALLRTDDPVELGTLVFCGLPLIVGSILGAKLAGRIDGGRIKRIMRAALIGSFSVLLIRTLLTAGTAGTATGLSPGKLCIAGALCFGTGILNMFGIPMKPVWTAIFLLLGLAPLSALTMVLVMASVSPLSGGVRVLKNGRYRAKMAFCAVLFGAVGALTGTLLAISLPAGLLNGVLIAVMLVAIVSMFRKEKRAA